MATGALPPASPLTPEIPEVEIPSVEETLKQYEDAGIFDQFGSMFSAHLGYPTAPPPYTGPFVFPPTFGGPGPSAAGYYGAPPLFPYPPYQGDVGASSSAAPPPPSDFASSAFQSLFGAPSVPPGKSLKI